MFVSRFLNIFFMWSDINPRGARTRSPLIYFYMSIVVNVVSFVLNIVASRSIVYLRSLRLALSQKRIVDQIMLTR